MGNGKLAGVSSPGFRCSSYAGLILLIASLGISDVAAQSVTNTADVVVTATRIATGIKKIGSSVTVITADDIAKKQFRGITDVLRLVPGVRPVQLGPIGSQTSVFSRGANANQTLVLIDGIEATDPSSANGAFNFAHLQMENVERIEVVRGPQSTLYGSDAIGSVINIITKRGIGKPSATVRAEFSDSDYINPSLSAAGQHGKFGYSVSASFLRTRGETVTADRVRPATADDEADGYENFTASARFDLALNEYIDATFVGRFIRDDSDIDPTAEDPDSQLIERQTFLRFETNGHFFKDMWEPTLSVNLTRYRRFDSNDPDPASATSRREENTGIKYKTELQNNVHLTDNNTVTLGLEHETERLQQSTNSDFGGFIVTGSSDDNVDNKALYLQDQYELFDRLSGTLGVRFDDHQSAGSATTWRMTGAYHLKETNTRIKGSYGTGFRAPALFELFGRTGNNFGGAFNGNPNLKPEKSEGWEVGFDQALLDDRLSFGAVYYSNDIDDLIICTTTTCNNTQNAETKGVEAYMEVQIRKNLSARLDYTYTRAMDADVKEDLQRRPKHKADLSVFYNPLDVISLIATFSAISSQRDVDFTTGGDATTPGHGLINLAGTWDVTKTVQLFARADNLLDKDYEVANGFRGTGLNAFVGAKAKF